MHTRTRLTYSATHIGHRLMYAHTPHADPSGSPTAPDTPTTWHCVKGDLHTTSTVGTEPPAGHRDRQQATGQAGPWAGWSLGVLGSRRNSCKRPRPLTSCLKAPRRVSDQGLCCELSYMWSLLKIGGRGGGEGRARRLPGAPERTGVGSSGPSSHVTLGELPEAPFLHL